jgi:DNA topoisomerase-1
MSIPKGENLLEITMERAIELIKMPRLPLNLGKYENEDVIVAASRFGTYIKYGKLFVSVPKGENPMQIKLQRAIELIQNKIKTEKNKIVMEFEGEDIKIMNGRFGAYISHADSNYKIAKNIDVHTLTLNKCKEIIAAQPPSVKKEKKSSKKVTKK